MNYNKQIVYQKYTYGPQPTNTTNGCPAITIIDTKKHGTNINVTKCEVGSSFDICLLKDGNTLVYVQYESGIQTLASQNCIDILLLDERVYKFYPESYALCLQET